jgi:hypothetical protein
MTPDERTKLTPEDVAWAADLTIWKIDLTDEGPIYGARMVVVDADGNDLSSSGKIHGNEALQMHSGLVATVVAEENDESISGKLRLYGASTRYSFEEVFDRSKWAMLGDPVRNGDLYLLGADSMTVSPGVSDPFDKTSKRLAVQLFTSPRDE